MLTSLEGTSNYFCFNKLHCKAGFKFGKISLYQDMTVFKTARATQVKLIYAN
jgi:hypothetical protein